MFPLYVALLPLLPQCVYSVVMCILPSHSENDRMTKTRLEDVKLLKSLKISLISDLMVENKKTKYFLTYVHM